MTAPTIPPLPAGSYDRWTLSAGYRNWIFQAGYALQSAELNEIQAALGTNHQLFVNATYGDGSMLHRGLVTPSNAALIIGSVAGGSNNVLTVDAISASAPPLMVGQLLSNPGLPAHTKIQSFGTGAGGTGTYNLNVDLSAHLAASVITVTTPSALGSTWYADQGDFYALGLSFKLAGANFFIAAGETSTLGIILTVSVVTALQDPTLYNPALGTQNYGLPGADRYQYLAVWGKSTSVISGQFFYPRAEFVNGQLVSPGGNTDQLPKGVTALIAAYDRNANGNYIVSGYQVNYVNNDIVTQAYRMQVSSGTANVNGYEQILAYSYNFQIPFPTATGTISGEDVEFTTTGNYVLSNTPIAAITSCIAPYGELQTITHGSFAYATDQLGTGTQSVFNIVAVNQTGTYTASPPWFSGGTTYVKGTDYALGTGANANKILWLGANEPTPGTNYEVYFYWNNSITPSIVSSNTAIYLSGGPGSFGVIPYGTGPSETTQPTIVSYTYYLPRYDIVVLEENVTIRLIEGIPSQNPTPPVYTGRGIILANVLSQSGIAPTITNSQLIRPETSQLVQMQLAIDDLKYNVAELALIVDVNSTDPQNTLTGIFVDPFIWSTGYPNPNPNSEADPGYTQSCNAAYGILYMNVPFNYVAMNGLTFLGLPTYLPITGNTQYVANFSHTDTRQVNSYVGAGSPAGFIASWPEQLQWIAADVEEEVTESPNFIPYWAIGGIPAGSTTYPGPPGSPNNVPGGTQVLTTYIDNTMITTPCEVPQITLTYAGGLFTPGELVNVYFDGVEISSVVADANGFIGVSPSASFTIPAGIQSGTKIVGVAGTTSGVIAYTTFGAEPLLQTVTNPGLQGVYFDPIAETFTPTTDGYLQEVGIWLTRNNTTPGITCGAYIDCFVCETNLGIPDTTRILGQARIYDNSTPTSTGSVPPDAGSGPETPENSTAFFFGSWPNSTGNYIHLVGGQEYAIIIASNSPYYSAFVSTLGEYDLEYGQMLSSKPTSGTLLYSTNESIWNLDFIQDITFGLYTAIFSPNAGPTQIGTVTINEPYVSDLILLAGTDVPANTTLTFTATVTDAITNTLVGTYPISPGTPITVPAIADPINVAVSYTMSTTDTTVSPRIDGQISIGWGQVGATLASPVNTGSSYTGASTGELDCWYVTREISTASTSGGTANTLKLYLERYQPSNVGGEGTVIVEWLFSDGVTWLPLQAGTGVSVGWGLVDTPFTPETSTLVSSFTGYISGTTMTVTAVGGSSPALSLGQVVGGSGVMANTIIEEMNGGGYTGTGGVGTYKVSVSQTVASSGSPEALTGSIPGATALNLTNANPQAYTRIRITLQTTDPALQARPYARNLRLYFY